MGFRHRDETRPTFGGTQVAFGAQLGKQELRKRFGFAHPGLESVPAVLAHVGVGVLGLRQKKKADRLLVRR